MKKTTKKTNAGNDIDLLDLLVEAWNDKVLFFCSALVAFFLTVAVLTTVKTNDSQEDIKALTNDNVLTTIKFISRSYKKDMAIEDYYLTPTDGWTAKYFRNEGAISFKRDVPRGTNLEKEIEILKKSLPDISDLAQKEILVSEQRLDILIDSPQIFKETEFYAKKYFDLKNLIRSLKLEVGNEIKVDITVSTQERAIIEEKEDDALYYYVVSVFLLSVAIATVFGISVVAGKNIFLRRVYAKETEKP